MVKITWHSVQHVEVMTLTGRLDASGCVDFDRAINALETLPAFLVVDMSAVPFISSMGLRSLLGLFRKAKESGGAIVLTGLQPFVSDVLNMAGFKDQWLILSDVNQAVLHLSKQTQTGTATTSRDIEDRHYRIKSQRDGAAVARVWTEKQSPVRAMDLTPVHVADLGLAVGTGGFGLTRDEAMDSLSLFLCTGSAVAFKACQDNAVADLLTVAKPEQTHLYVRNAIGLCSKPMTFMQSDLKDASLTSVLSDIGAIAASPSWAAVLLFENAEPSSPGTVLAIAMSSQEHLRVYGLFSGHTMGSFSEDLGDVLKKMSDLDQFLDLKTLDAETTIVGSTNIWLYAPLQNEDGILCGLTVEKPADTHFPDEWDIITRRIYTDAAKIILKPLHGGYTAATFQVESFDASDRRMIPTVLKIAPSLITAREERAYHTCVKPFILNNSTVIMGQAEHGGWSGIRYNFVGVNGAESRLSWMAEHYVKRTVPDLKPVWDAIFLTVLSPWYGQPVRRAVCPFVDHNPIQLFKQIPEHAREALGIDPQTPMVNSPEIGRMLPNPYFFFTHYFERYCHLTREWYTSITHGDLNLNNILLDEKENIYIIDFSETANRNVLSDFARLEPLLTIQMTRMADEQDAGHLLHLLEGLLDVSALSETPPFRYTGNDPLARKAYETIVLLRQYASRMAKGQTDLMAYWLPLLQWTLPIVSFVQMPVRYKRCSMIASALICEKLIVLLDE